MKYGAYESLRQVGDTDYWLAVYRGGEQAEDVVSINDNSPTGGDAEVFVTLSALREMLPLLQEIARPTRVP